MLDKNELRAALARRGERQNELAKVLGMSPSTLSAKINGAMDFKRNDIELMAVRYNLTMDDVRRIFFTEIGA